MFQLMLAIELSKRLGDAPIYGYRLPDWGIIGPKAPKRRLHPDEMFLIYNHKFSLKNLLTLLNGKLVNGVVIEGWGMRVEYYGPPQRFQRLFTSIQETPVLSESELLIHVRAEDILSGWHPEYFPMAFSYFERIIAVTGLSPVFMGQIGDDNYSIALKNKFKGARFLPHASPVVDFQTIRRSHHIALSISSFSWLSAWLSETAKTIHMPLAGLFEPKPAGANLIPFSDPRYRYYKVPFPLTGERNGIDLVDWAEGSGPTYELFLKVGATRSGGGT